MSSSTRIMQDFVKQQWRDNMWAEKKNILHGAAENVVDKILTWFEKKLTGNGPK